jgi:hypothetical protein
MVRQYGLLAFGVYSTLSFTVFCGCMYSITCMGINQNDVAGWFNKIRNVFGLPDQENANDEKDSVILKFLPPQLRDPETVGFITRVLLGMAMTKLFLPIKLPLVGIITPILARRLTKMGYLKRK